MIPIWLHGLLIPVTLYALCKAADWLVMSGSRIARAWGMSELIIGIVLVGFGTSAPEFAASATAALQGLSEVSVANVAGSNVFNICLILGLCSLIFPLDVDRTVLRVDLPVLLFATALALAFAWNMEIVRWESSVLLGLLAVYLVGRIRVDRGRRVPVEGPGDEEGHFLWSDLFVLIGGLALLTASAHVLVTSSVELARWLGMSEWLIGVTIVAAGTSLPELAASFAAAVRHKSDISVGNLVGSNIFNLFGVLGFAGLCRPLALQEANRWPLLMILPATVAAGLTMWTGGRVSRFEGGVLLLVFAVFFAAGA